MKCQDGMRNSVIPINYHLCAYSVCLLCWVELTQHCCLEVCIWDLFINKGMMPRFKYEVFSPKAWVLKIWFLIQLSSEQGVWGSDWIRWWIFWWSPSKIAVFVSGSRRSMGMHAERDNSSSFISFHSQLPSDEQTPLPHDTLSLGRGSTMELPPTTMEHTDWIKIPEAMSFTDLSSFMSLVSGIHSEWWNIWLKQLENANSEEASVYFGECILPFLAFPWLSDLLGTIPHLCFLFLHWHMVCSWTEKVPFTGGWVNELTCSPTATAEYALNWSWPQIYWSKTILYDNTVEENSLIINSISRLDVMGKS